MLEQIARHRVFASVTAIEQLAGLYVSSDRLAGLHGDERPEAQLMRPLFDEPQPQRFQVVGPSGAGKTGFIFKVLGDLARRTAAGRAHEVLVVNVGDDPSRLEDGAGFMRTVVQLVARQGHRFATIESDVLRAASADEVTRTGAQVQHRGGLSAPVASYSVALTEAYRQEKFGDNPIRARDDFEDVVRLVARDYRPVIVIDDTEHFVNAADGRVDRVSVRNLYHHAIRALAELDQLDIIVAVHPAYEDVDAVIEVSERFAFRRVEVPALAVDRDEPAIAAILQRRLDRNGLRVRAEDVVDAGALAQLAGAYFLGGHDLRTVLNVADAAASAAHREGAARIAPRHVQPVLDQLRR
jgi:Cdc6-like AAA superfamily ATPase